LALESLVMGCKRYHSTLSARLTAVSEDLIEVFEHCLTNSDEDVRRKAVALAMSLTDREFLWCIAERLVDRFTGDAEAVSQRAAESLAEMGPTAFSVVVLRHSHARKEALQKRLCGVIERMAENQAKAKRAQ